MIVDADRERARARRFLAYVAAGYAFVGGLTLTIVALFIEASSVEVAIPIYLAGLSPASMVIGWFKGKEAT